MSSQRERPEFIQLEQGDDVPSIRDRISFFHGKRILLIWPEEGTALTRKLDLVLIQREAMRRAIQLALVTHDPQVIKHAQELNISTFETIGASERSRWKRGRSKVFTSRFQRPQDTAHEPEELMPVASRVRAEENPESPARRRLTRLIVLVLLVIAIAIAALVVLPSATVTLNPVRVPLNVDVMITADPDARNVDIENATVPATRLQLTIEETSTIPTTGSLDLADLPATGSVIFVNQTNAGVTIPAGTTVSTSAGTPIMFRTTEEARVPAGTGQQLEAPIEALQSSAGEIGNVESGLINTVVGSLADSVTVLNINPTTGGLRRSVAAVSESDRERLLAAVRQQLQSRAYVEMLPLLEESQFLIPETVQIIEERSDWTTFSASVNEVTDSLSLTMRATIQATAVNEGFGQQVTFAQLAQQIPRGREIKQNTITYERGPVNEVFQNGQVTFEITGTGVVESQINIGQIQQRLAGLEVNEALAHMITELDLVPDDLPQVEISPEWFGRLPFLPIRINIRLIDA
ncbi:MAG: baseplate J/gp47 family protein [Anaerolineae bacterium]|nr:baseplate J/gp47 family protein [Anaerolineae bacterium]